VICFKQATNSSSWRSFKLFACESWSLFWLPKLPEALAVRLGIPREELVHDIQESKQTFPDLTWVPPHCTAQVSKEMWEHQMHKVGLHTWATKASARQEAMAAAVALVPVDACRPPLSPEAWRWQQMQLDCLKGRFTHVSMYLGGTDAGPDQTGTAKLVTKEVADDPYVWVVWVFCVQHQLHLMVKRQLARVAKFFSSLAKMSNTWRSPNAAAAIFRSWAHKFGLDRAREVAIRLPPRVLRGRFGAIHNVGKFFIKATRPETAFVFKDVFDPESEERLAPDLLVEDADGESYQSKIGRWRKDAVQAVRQDEGSS